MLKGITVTLYTKMQTGTDAFNRPVYTEIPEQVDNVLVTPASAEDIINEMNLTGKRLAYQICIPKGDTHDWLDKRIQFFGTDFKTYGPVEEWIESMTPLSWNKKVKCEQYGE